MLYRELRKYIPFLVLVYSECVLFLSVSYCLQKLHFCRLYFPFSLLFQYKSQALIRMTIFTFVQKIGNDICTDTDTVLQNFNQHLLYNACQKFRVWQRIFSNTLLFYCKRLRRKVVKISQRVCCSYFTCSSQTVANPYFRYNATLRLLYLQLLRVPF